MHRILVGFSCNNACVFCAQGDLRLDEAGPSPDARVRRELARALKPGGPRRAIAFVGGEPTLHDELPEWVALAKGSGAGWVLVQTNGRRLAYPGYARKLAEAGADALDVSLHGSSAAMHEYHTGVPGSWAQTLLGVERSASAGLRVGATIVVTRSNFRNLEAIVALARRQGACGVHLDLAVALGRACGDWARVVPSAALVLPYLASAVRCARALGLEVLTSSLATGPKVRRLFSGIGTVERRAAGRKTEPKPPSAPPRRPAPGHREVHISQKKTGEALRGLFPGIFEPRTESEEIALG